MNLKCKKLEENKLEELEELALMEGRWTIYNGAKLVYNMVT